jgi:hypothetical protein
VKVKICESTPGEFKTPGAAEKAHDAFHEALCKAIPRGAEWDLVDELAKGMALDYEARMRRLQEQIAGLV